MNKKGFTLIEILAVIIILGIVGTIGIAAISRNIENSRKSATVDLGINYVESLRSMRAEDKLPYDLKYGEALLIPFKRINGVNLEKAEETPYGKLIWEYCYVIIVNNDNKIYSYYLTMKDETNHAINNVEVNDLNDSSVVSISDNSVIPYISFNSDTITTLGDKKYKIKEDKIIKDSNGDIKYIVLDSR